MPTLDVTEILDDPEFVDELVLHIKTEVVGDNGRPVVTETDVPFTGVVTSDKGRNRDLIAEGQRVTGSILVHTTTLLTSGGTDRSADTITWNSRDYTVISVDDYSRYGVGFICAHCDLLPLDGGSNG